MDDNIVLPEEKKLDNICEECNTLDDSVVENLMMHSFKICNTCKTSKLIFPI